jgi:pre-mRNA-processing factor 17
VYFWDYRSSRRVKMLRAHSQVAIGVAWNPAAPSKMATCSWDGSIKLWE